MSLTDPIAKDQPMGIGDVRQFDRLAPVYGRIMTELDPSTIEHGLSLAGRPIEVLLDVGGGTGRSVRAVDATRRIVVDPADGMLRQISHAEIEVARAGGARLPFSAESVDAVLVVDALHHIADQRGVVTDAHRVLRSGGVLVVVDFDPGSMRGRLLAVFERLIGFESTLLAPSTFRAMLAQSGFDPSTVSSGFTYTIVGSKPNDT